MFGLRIIAAIIITLMVVLGIVSTNPTVGGFFENIMDRFSGITVFETDTTQRGVEFSLNVNSYDDISVKTRKMVNITIDPKNISMIIKDGNVKPEKAFVVYEYRGQITVGKNTVKLDGNYEKFEFVDKTVSFGSGNIKVDGSFANMTIDGLALNDYTLTNVSGKITANEIETIFVSNDIYLKSPLGFFTLDDNIKIEGFADKISIPSRNLSIG